MRTLRWWSLLLVPGGFVAGHEIGYQGAAALGWAPLVQGGHGYVRTLVFIGLALGLATAARTFLAGLYAQLPPVRLHTLVLGQLALFLAVELAEHASVGMGPLDTLTEPAVVLGLVGQLVVAGASYLIVRSTHEAGSAFAKPRRRAFSRRRLAWSPSGNRVAPTATDGRATSTRGPPRPLIVA